MALRDKDSIRHKLDEEVYVSTDLSTRMPKYRFPDEGHSPRNAYAVVRDELLLDGNARQNLATFGQGRLPQDPQRLLRHRSVSR